jgi:hypothetical protein
MHPRHNLMATCRVNATRSLVVADMYDVATGQFKHAGKTKAWATDLPPLIPKGKPAGSGKVGLLL